MVLLQRKLLFQGSRGDPTFSRGGGVGGCPTFFPRGVGVQMVISIETHIACDFLGGSGPLSPPLDPHMFLMALSLSDVCLGRYRNISSRLVPLNNFLQALQYFYRAHKSGASFVDHFYYLCFIFVFVMLYCLFLVALWSPTGKGLASWLSCV